MPEGRAQKRKKKTTNGAELKTEYMDVLPKPMLIVYISRSKNAFGPDPLKILAQTKKCKKTLNGAKFKITKYAYNFKTKAYSF